MTAIQLSRLHFPVSNLGFGRRMGIWMQGCTLRCRGCVSRDTWPAIPGSASDIESVRTWIAGHLDIADGITISGGEPTDQPEALRELLCVISELRSPARSLDILVFTGRSLSEALEKVPGLGELADVIISEPFVRELSNGSLPLRGSSNQVVTTCTALGNERYGEHDLGDRYRRQREMMGVHVNSDSVWLVGIPRPGDLQILEHELAGEGIRLTRRSWLS